MMTKMNSTVTRIAGLPSEPRSGSCDPNRESLATWVTRIHDLDRYINRSGSLRLIHHLIILEK